MNVSAYQGGRPLLVRSAGVAVVALALTAVGAALDPRRALYAYHVAFTYWTGIAVGALLLLLALHATKARWAVAARRIIEVIPLSSALLLVLFVPIALGVRTLFPWAHPEHLEGELRHLAEHRAPWLNVPFFLLRTAVYFGIWIAVSHLLFGWSVRQDQERGTRLTAMQRALGAGAIPFVAIALTFAAFDWQMSLDLRLFSTIFGVYYFAGSFLSAIAVVILALVAGGAELLGLELGPSHYHALGKLLLAFFAFWAYIAFSQYMLIWIANLPEEVPWYLQRNSTGWLAVGIFLALFHFVVPFFVLLSRDLKRTPRRLAVMAVWALVVHYVDVYWVMMLAASPDAPRPHWTDLTALVGIGAAALAFALWRLRGRSAVPVGDPYLDDSLRYDPS
jgi:hypothetical protein